MIKYGELYFCQIRRNGLENIFLRPIKMEETIWFDLSNNEIDESLILSYVLMTTFPYDFPKLKNMDMTQEDLFDKLKEMGYIRNEQGF